MKKYKIILPVVAVAAAVITIVIIAFGWYLSTDRMTDMKFNILQIDSLVSLYEANDTNYNGVPDLVEAGNENKYYNAEANAQVDYKNIYHDEMYSFNYVDQRYALSQDSQANLLNAVTILNAAPSKVYSYKFEITNYSNLENKFKFAFIDENIDTTILSNFETRLGIVVADSSVTYSNWTNFVNNSTYDGIELNPLSETMIIPAHTGTLSVGRLDLWLQVRIKPQAANFTANKFNLPKYRLTLSYEQNDEASNG